MASAVPNIEFTPAGLVIPTEAAILAGKQTDIDTAFGGGVNPALETPQGQIATSDTAIIADKNADFAYMVNQFDPRYASGRFQDALARLYFIDRLPATSTAVTCVLGGLSGTVVPQGTFAQDTSGNTYSLLGAVTIGSSGTVSSSWQNVATGPIACPAGTLTKVYQAIPGWDTITNPTDGVTGKKVESRAAFELRRQQSVALNGRGTCPSIYANVFETVPNVLDVYVIDNPRGVVVNKGSTNYPMLPHSVYVAVVGGDDQLIGEAIWQKKDVGCDYNGNTTVTVTDPSGYAYPPPSYQVIFNRPTDTAVKFAVQIADVAGVPSNVADLIKAAIIAQFNGDTGSIPARIGAAVIAANYYAAVLGASSSIILLSVQVGIGTANQLQVTMGIDQAPTLGAGDISVTLV